MIGLAELSLNVLWAQPECHCRAKPECPVRPGMNFLQVLPESPVRSGLLKTNQIIF